MKKSFLIHNPRCSKSSAAKEILENEGVAFEAIDYLKNGLKEKLVTQLPTLLGLNFKEMIRDKEDIYKELQLSEKNLSDKEWVATIMQYPVLLERPIFIFNDRAIIARPPELVKKIL